MACTPCEAVITTLVVCFTLLTWQSKLCCQSCLQTHENNTVLLAAGIISSQIRRKVKLDSYAHALSGILGVTKITAMLAGLSNN